MNSMNADHRLALRTCREILEHNSKSFALAVRLLPAAERDLVAAVYAFCRRVDDAIDHASASEQPAALERIRAELEQVYENRELRDPSLRAFSAVVNACALPKTYPSELIEGMAMDVHDARYDNLEQLLLYCHRVAAVVGLMMCHVFGVTREDALREAAHLGIAMQLTNICRDVREDFTLGRLYLPRDLLRNAGAPELPHPVLRTFPEDPRTHAAMRQVIQELLAEADRYYASAQRGISALPFRAGMAVRVAARLYREIGKELAARSFDPLRGRAVVSTSRKLRLTARAVTTHGLRSDEFLRERLRATHGARPPRTVLTFPMDVLSHTEPTTDRAPTVSVRS
jgi:phytoene synthase